MLIFERTTCHLPYLGLQAAASAAASALYIYYVVIGGRFAPPYKYMVKYIKQKQQQEQQLQSLLPPELDTLTLHEGGLPNIKGGLPLFRPLEYGETRVPNSDELPSQAFDRSVLMSSSPRMPFGVQK